MYHDVNAVFYSDTYHPIQAGSIDGTDTVPHDNAVYRALLATSTGLYDPTGDAKAEGDPFCKIFVGRLSKETTEATLQEVMSKYGRIKSLRLVRDIVTGASQGYAFVEYETEKEMRHAYEAAHLIKIDGIQVLVDYNRQLLMPGWIPRRLGGGLGGRKESGQLRFGGRDRPFRKPLRPIPEKELQKLGIPLPGHFMQRYEIPPLPKRRSSSRSQRREEEDNKWHSERLERKRAYRGEELPERDHSWHSDRDGKWHSDGDDKWQHYHKKDNIIGEGTRRLHTDKNERYDWRRKDEDGYDVDYEHEDGRRRPDGTSKHEERHGHRDDRKHKRRDYDWHERPERDDHYKRGSGRAHGDYKHGGDERMEHRGYHYEDEGKRRHLAEASDDEIDNARKRRKERKLHKREMDERSSGSREPSVEDRWKP